MNNSALGRAGRRLLLRSADGYDRPSYLQTATTTACPISATPL